MSTLKELFGLRIKELRRKRKLTQEQLAELVNVDIKHISCIERGKNFPSSDLIERLAGALQVNDLTEIFEFSHLKEKETLLNQINDIINELDEEKLKFAHRMLTTLKN